MVALCKHPAMVGKDYGVNQNCKKIIKKKPKPLLGRAVIALNKNRKSLFEDHLYFVFFAWT
jgi:hypothetical protein